MTNALFVLEPFAFDLAYGQELHEEVARRARVLGPPQTSESVRARADLLREATILFSGWGGPRLDESFLVAAPQLRAVFYAAGTIKDLVTPAFWERDIMITTAAAANAVPVADYTLAAVLFSLKHAWRHVLETKRLGRLARPGTMPGAYRAKIGLISLGHIGRLVGERLQPFDLEVLAFDPVAEPRRAQQLGVRLTTLEEIFGTCDVVSLHAPLLPETAGMLGAEHFALMKTGATFINTARGALVRDAELIRVLTDRPDLTAVLDVTWPEPPVAGSPLYTLPNIVLTPHLAGARDGECRRLGQAMIDEFDRWLRGEPLRWAIAREQAARIA